MHQEYYDNAKTLLTHGKGKVDLRMVVYLCPIKNSLVAYFIAEFQTKQNPIGMLFSNAANIVTFEISLNLHFGVRRSPLYQTFQLFPGL